MACKSPICINHIGGVMISVLASSVVGRGFVGICCFSAKYAALRRKSKDSLARNKNNVSKWGDMFILIRGLVSVSYHYKNPTKHVGLVHLQLLPH